MKWASHSLIGHVILYGVAFLVIWDPVMTVLIYSEGDLTISWALHTAIMSVIGGGVSGVLIWFIISRPLIRWKKQVERTKASKHRNSGGEQ